LRPPAGIVVLGDEQQARRSGLDRYVDLFGKGSPELDGRTGGSLDVHGGAPFPDHRLLERFYRSELGDGRIAVRGEACPVDHPCARRRRALQDAEPGGASDGGARRIGTRVADVPSYNSARTVRRGGAISADAAAAPAANATERSLRLDDSRRRPMAPTAAERPLARKDPMRTDSRNRDAAERECEWLESTSD